MKKVKHEIIGIGEEFGCGDCFKSFNIKFNCPVNTEWLENVICKGVESASQQITETDLVNSAGYLRRLAP